MAGRQTTTQEAPELNPADRHWDDEFNGIVSNLRNAENTSGNQDAIAGGAKSDDATSASDLLKAKESGGSPLATATPFQNKTTPKIGPVAPKGLGGKVVALFKKRSAVVGITAVLGLASTIPFLGAMSLPFALFGNLNLQSVLQGMSQYSEDYMAYRVFGNKTSVSFKDDKMAGLTGAQIEELEANGVKLNNPTKTITGKTVYESIEVGGNTITNEAEFKSAMRAHPELRAKVIISKPSLWKSAQSAVAKNILRKENVKVNPDIKEGTPQEQRAQVLEDVVDGAAGEATTATGSGEGASDEQRSQQAAAKNDAEAIASDYNDRIAAAKKAVSEGAETATNLEMENIPALLSVEENMSPNLIKTAWNTINPLGLTSDLCTAYQIADTANTLARVFVVSNLIRLALDFRASVEKVMAGDGDPSTLSPYLEALNTQNPSTGESFDQSAAAQMVFNNSVSTDPMALTALGGAGVAILYGGMRGINKFFGLGNAHDGRRTIKSTCAIANNLGVQVGALAGSVALAVFTGTGSAWGEAGALATARITISEGIKATIKDLLENVLKEVTEKGAITAVKDLAKDALKNAGKKSWAMARGILKSPRDLMSLALVGTQTFAMGYIVDAVTGGNIANALLNGTSFISGVITGQNSYDYRNAIGSGGVVTNISTATAYLNNDYSSYQKSYIAYMQDQARSTPFDITNQYSAVGSALSSFRKVFGTNAFSSVSSALTSLASIPASLPKLFFGSAYASDTPDLQAINDAVGNQFYSENNVAVQITGTPLAIFNKSYSFADIKGQLIDSASPQISYDGDDETTGEPKLSVIPGTRLEKYINKCHNPDNTEADEMFRKDNEDGSTDPTAFDLTCSTFGRSNGVQVDSNTTISAAEASLYDDAVGFVTQVSASPSDTTSDTTTTTTNPVSSEEWKSYSNGKIPLTSLAPLSSVGLSGCSSSISVPYLAPSALSSLKRMDDAYYKDTSKHFDLASCYRTYAQQQAAWSDYKSGTGNLAAQPGTSNHGWSKAVDISMKSDGGYDSPQYKWLKQHATEYGWITGRVSSEPWHVEYTGALP